jgi:tetratricopeptide (TPR) repeat protein
MKNTSLNRDRMLYRGICSTIVLLSFLFASIPGKTVAESFHNGPGCETLAGEGRGGEMQDEADTSGMIRRAHELAEKRDFSGAKKILRDILAVDERNVASMYELGTVLSWDGQYDESIALFRKLLRMQPYNSSLHHNIGDVLLWKADRTAQQEFRRAAIREFEECVAASPGDCEARKKIGAAYLRLGAADTAYHILFLLKKDFPGDDEAVRLLAEASSAQGNDIEAISWLHELVNRKPRNAEIRWKLAEYLIRTGDLEAADQQYKAILERNQNHSGALIGRARLAQWKGDLDQSREYYENAVLWTSIRNPDPYLGMGDVQSMRGRWKEAVENYSRAMTIDPANDRSKSGLRQAQWMKGPRLDCDYGRNRASQSLDQDNFGVALKTSFFSLGIVALGYREWRFTESDASTLRRRDFSFTWKDIPAQWLKTEFGYTYSQFPDGLDRNRALHSWAVSLTLSPSVMTRFDLGYSRVPFSESFATINPNYHSDVVGAGIDLKFSQVVSTQISGDFSRQSGEFPVGYWNSYRSEWVTLITLPDRSERVRMAGQLSFQLSREPDVTIRSGISDLRFSQSTPLPYWSPASFLQEHVSFGFGKSGASGFGIRSDLHATHVHEGKQWGYGGSVTITVPLGGSFEIVALGSIEEVGTAVPWNGTSVNGSFRWRFAE